jgi:hypothetical protein
MSLKKTIYIISLVLLGNLLLLLTACGGGGGGGGGTGTEYDYTVNLSPDKTSVAPGGTVNLNLQYDAPPSNAGIAWTLSCSQSDCGSVSSAGIYTAPAQVEEQMVVGISAKSKDNPSKGYYVEIWVTGKIVVRLTPDTVAGIHVNETIQFSATVNSTDTAVAWQVNGVAGGNATAGTITSGGLYTAPVTVPDPDTVTITAIAHVDETASASMQMHVWSELPITVSVSPRDPSVNINETVQFTATVENSTNTAVEWQVNGVPGGSTTLGTISATGLFTAPASVPSPAVETITAISQADSSKSDSTFVTITNLQNTVLSGAYAFQISGSDSDGYMHAAIGSLNFDGDGGLSGKMDVNSITAATPQTVEFSGNYTIGDDDRGKMNLFYSSLITLAFTVNESGNDAKLIGWDNTGTRYTGSMQKQTATDFALSKVSGDYAFSAYGTTMDNIREIAIGRFHSDGAGHLTGLDLDSAEGSDTPVNISDVTGSLSLSDSVHGRGAITFQESSTLVHFAFYMVNASELYILSIDAVPGDNPLVIGHVLSQVGGPFSNASLDGFSVFGIAGQNPQDISDRCVFIGQWQATGSTHSLTGVQASNCGGTIAGPLAMSASYSISSDGRGVFSNSTHFAPNVFYMIAKNKAFFMEGGDPQGVLGMAEPQTVTTFNNSLFSGTYRIGPISLPSAGADLSQGFLVADGAGNFNGTEDVYGEDLITLTFAGSDTVDSTGKTLVTFTSPETFHYIAYPVSADRFIGISIEPGDALANLTTLDK